MFPVLLFDRKTQNTADCFRDHPFDLALEFDLTPCRDVTYLGWPTESSPITTAETELLKHMREAANPQMRALIRTTDFGGVASKTAMAFLRRKSANTRRRTPRIASLRLRMGEQGCGMC